MTGFDLTTTLADIVTERPVLAATLERLGLDYCCHGDRTLSDAATTIGLDPRQVADELAAVGPAGAPVAWAVLGAAELVDHVEQVHHRYLAVALPRLTGLVDKIAVVHGERHPELVDVRHLFHRLRAELEPHLAQEEAELFPLVRRLAGEAKPADGDVQRLHREIGAMKDEHEGVGALLEALRSVSAGYQVPADGCASYQACYGGLAELEADVHLHVHKENNVLVPELLRRWPAIRD